MVCQRCRRNEAAWLDEYADLAVCNGCCPSREEDYGAAFVRVLTQFDARRLAEKDREQQGRGWAR
jgi:hypothetical protein